MQVVDYDAIEKNAQHFKRLLGKSKLCAVLKNNAYGHGLHHVARHLVDIADCFAVGSVDEAEEVQPYNKEVLILLPQNARNTVRALKLGCTLTIDSFETLNRVDDAAQKLKTPARAHVKFDSGMSRLGFTQNDIDELVSRLRQSRINVVGVFSHFYSDSVDDCDAQFDRFVPFADSLEQQLGRPLIKHVANTAATLLSPKYHLDMVRVGLGLYGYSDGLRPAKSVYADVIAAKWVEKGSVVGYGAKYVCESATRIAVLNVGYAMGLSRTLVGAKVKIGSCLYPIVAICMAMTLVDVGNDDVAVGQVATLLGDGVNIANDQVIIYELLCNLK